MRRIWLNADDYALAPGVSRAIRELIEAGRINATSVMVTSPHFSPDEVEALKATAAGKRVSIGLHLTLTAPFSPLTPVFGAQQPCPTLGGLIGQAHLGRLDAIAMRREVEAQVSAFAAAFGFMPQHIDGHQHVQVLPIIRQAVIEVAAGLAPQALLRDCAPASPTGWLATGAKGMVIGALARGFAKLAARHGLRSNPAFAGIYDFAAPTPFADIFPRFLNELPADAIVMCHPGHVDAALKSLDPVTDRREEERRYFLSPAFAATLEQAGIQL